eukprot:CAMPEP_0113464748 /NCGR_PEP_ID=MMETSP0014_2-20120614/13363_1 /TAXON_ID=2857 /ORGANISM="Nitzschia sp." /LENGTH=609 /DNA_ID=CAMNT_0000356843 /DNA_START=37 /DNA_END=1863 /DNA_ORIENTATION=- /assembly_acc=CAM_ASM_000159
MAPPKLRQRQSSSSSPSTSSSSSSSSSSSLVSSEPPQSHLSTGTTSSKSNGKKPSSNNPPRLVKFVARNVGPKCPFGQEVVGFSIFEGGCVCLKGASGRGKTTLASLLTSGCNHQNSNSNNGNGSGSGSGNVVLKRLDISIDTIEWDSTLPKSERCGVLFQQATLLDELTVAGNLKVALEQRQGKLAGRRDNNDNNDNDNNNNTDNSLDLLHMEMKQLLDVVGLDYDRDASKRVTELSGGMSRRASLALQLAQHKHLVVLDEPFAGLDYDAAVSVAKELVKLRLSPRTRTAFLLISHEPHLTKLVMDEARTSHLQNEVVELLPPATTTTASASAASSSSPHRPSLFGTTFYDRFIERLGDYVVYSLPLICLAFVACGLAISMLSADLLHRLEISQQVLDLVEKEVRPLIKMLTGEDANTFQMMGIRFKVNSMLNQTVPPAKAKLFAIGLCKLFVLEVGPLLTALLLCGRIGGSYAGRVATLESSQQNRLLQVLGISPRYWTLYPSLLAAVIAGPFLTVVGTCLALMLGGWVGPLYGVGAHQQYRDDVIDSLFPPLRIRWLQCLWDEEQQQQQKVGEEGIGIVGSDSFLRFLTKKMMTLQESFQSTGFDW